VATRLGPSDGRDSFAFGEKLLNLLDEGAFTATYKYAELRAEHDMVVVCTVATRITFMHQSKLLVEGALAEEVGARPELQRVSLGESAT
jgi:ABC-type branched-subunit amino acid transport system ATPase component